MKAHAVAPAQVGAERLVGWVACHNVRDAGGAVVVRKGTRLDRDAADRLARARVAEVHLIEMEAGDLHEEPAGERLARAVAGSGATVRESSGGQWTLAADVRGILRIDVGALAAANAVEGVSVYTLYDGQIVDRGEVVARAKVTPLVIAETLVREAEGACGRAGVVAIRTFRPLSVGAVAPASLPARARERFEAALREKLAWFGAPLAAVVFARDEAVELASAIEACGAAGAAIVVAAGANALDPLDPLFVAVERLGGRFVRRGVPAHPGSLLWLASLGPTPILGMPSCGMFSQATLFDLLLPRLLAGDAIGSDDLAGYGHGGLLGRDMAFRFPPYRAGRDRGAVED